MGRVCQARTAVGWGPDVSVHEAALTVVGELGPSHEIESDVADAGAYWTVLLCCSMCGR